MKGNYKTYICYYRSKYYPFEGIHRRRVYAPNKKWIRANWYGLMETDEYTLIKSEEVK